MANTEKLRNACEAAVTAFTKINKEEYAPIQSNLEYCLGSYDYDKNPAGLYEYGNVALTDLKSYKEANPRKVNKKIITDLEKSLTV